MARTAQSQPNIDTPGQGAARLRGHIDGWFWPALIALAVLGTLALMVFMPPVSSADGGSTAAVSGTIGPR